MFLMPSDQGIAVSPSMIGLICRNAGLDERPGVDAERYSSAILLMLRWSFAA